MTRRFPKKEARKKGCPAAEFIPPPMPPIVPFHFVYDYEYAETPAELKEIIRHINEQRYVLIAVTQNWETYTVFFRRAVDG